MSDFFDQLREFSLKVFEKMGLNQTVCAWTSGAFEGTHPTGAILHYTSGNSLKRAVRYFMNAAFNARASAHVVVDDGWPKDMRELAESFPEIHSLPAMVVQCLPPDKTAWHASWTNGTCYGIEMVNAGEIRKGDDGNWVTWRENWTENWHSKKHPVYMFGRYWEPYTPNQVLAVIAVLRNLRKRGHSLLKHLVLGHEQVQGVNTPGSSKKNKLDPGPLFPLHGVRLAAFEDIDPRTYQWFNHFCGDYRYGEAMRDGIALDWWRSNGGHFIEAKKAWAKLMLAPDENWVQNAGDQKLTKTLLKVLGYYIPEVSTGIMTVDGRSSVRVFQKMSGLNVDGDPGVKTRTALKSRFEERGFTENLVSP